VIHWHLSFENIRNNYLHLPEANSSHEAIKKTAQNKFLAKKECDYVEAARAYTARDATDTDGFSASV
jgi:hypothetical protein